MTISHYKIVLTYDLFLIVINLNNARLIVRNKLPIKFNGSACRLFAINYIRIAINSNVNRE